MPVNDHLKIAASELMIAASLLRQEIDELRKEDANLRTIADRTTSQLNEDVRARQHELSYTEGAIQRQVQDTIQRIHKQIADQKHQADRDRRQIEEAIRMKQVQIDAIERQSRAIMP